MCKGEKIVDLVQNIWDEGKGVHLNSKNAHILGKTED
jgi:hypothetical protein